MRAHGEIVHVDVVLVSHLGGIGRTSKVCVCVGGGWQNDTFPPPLSIFERGGMALAPLSHVPAILMTLS